MSYPVFIFHLLLALSLGLVIGLERQLTGHPAGIRTNVLICLGTCFFTMFPILNGSDQVFRVGSSIISGVGFLCSGFIFKNNDSVRGINTAATLWCTAAIGILSGMDNPAWALTATACLVLSNIILRPLARKINAAGMGEDPDREYRISIVCTDSSESEIRQLLIRSNTCKTLYLSNLKSGDIVGNKVEVIAGFCSVGKPKNTALESIVSKALKNENVISAGWQIV